MLSAIVEKSLNNSAITTGAPSQTAVCRSLVSAEVSGYYVFMSTAVADEVFDAHFGGGRCLVREDLSGEKARLKSVL